MDFLTIDGTPVAVARDSAELSADVVGERARAFDGTLRSTQRAVKRRWKLSTPPLLAAEAEALWTRLTAFAAPRRCAGEMIGGTTEVECEVEVGSVKYIAGPGAARQSFEFTLVEV